MTLSRRYVLGGLLALLTVLAAAMLADVLATVFFAVTVAYLLLPLKRWFVVQGLSPRIASAASTVAAFVAVLVVFLPLVGVVLLRLETILEMVSSLPNTISIDAFGFQYSLTLEQVERIVVTTLRSLARSLAVTASLLAVKLALFVILVFSLLVHAEETRLATLAIVPPGYRDVVEALNRRARETLFAIYVLQAATAFGTFLIALPLFWLLGYQVAIGMAVVAAVLQFLPIVGPSILVVGVAAYHVAVGDLVAAALMGVLGSVFVAWLPDMLIRPWLSQQTAHLSGGLYFIGFTGGLLTIGPIGIIAGPLVVALVTELADLLSSEMNEIPVDEL